jgi:hypothetical protein
MNLQCPSCLKPLTVPDQYAGQMMKCPLCASTFSVPAQGGGTDPLPQLPSLPPPTSTPMNPTLPVSTPTPAAVNTPTPTPTPTTTPPATTPATTPTSSTSSRTTTARSTSDGYTQSCALYFSAQVMRWVAPAAVVLIFILQFFPWVGVYPGGVPMFTQGAWGAAFGAISTDEDMATDAYDDAKRQDNPPPKSVDEFIEKSRPPMSPLLVFYLLLFMLALVITVAALLLDLGVVAAQSLPPAIQPLLRWRWMAVAALNLVVLVFFLVQLLLGFGYESKVASEAAAQTKIADAKDTKTKKVALARYGAAVATVSRTVYLTFVFWLHILAVLGAWTMYCLHDRGGKPDPKLELVW